MKQSKNEINLGEGSVGRLLLTLAVPSVIAQLVNLLYNLVDRIYIGHIPENGGVALTGLGLCFPILMIVTAFSGLIGYGGAPRVAIFMGKGKNDEAEEILGNCTMALIVIALILVVVLQFAAEPLMPYPHRRQQMRLRVCRKQVRYKTLLPDGKAPMLLSRLSQSPASIFLCRYTFHPKNRRPHP